MSIMLRDTGMVRGIMCTSGACFMTGRTLREHLVESGHTTEREGHEQLVETDRAPASALIQSWQPSIGLCLEASPISGCVQEHVLYGATMPSSAHL